MEASFESRSSIRLARTVSQMISRPRSREIKFEKSRIDLIASNLQRNQTCQPYVAQNTRIRFSNISSSLFFICPVPQLFCFITLAPSFSKPVSGDSEPSSTLSAHAPPPLDHSPSPLRRFGAINKSVGKTSCVCCPVIFSVAPPHPRCNIL